MAKARTRIMLYDQETRSHFYVGPGEDIPEEFLDTVDVHLILGFGEKLPGADDHKVPGGFDLSIATVEQVLLWAGEDEERVRRALNWERENKGRATVIGALEARLS